MRNFKSFLEEKTLTPAEKKKREEVAKAIERDNPDMPMAKKMAIATATAKKVAEASEDDMNEQYVKTTPGHLTKTADRIGAKFDSKRQAYFKNGIKIGHVQTASGTSRVGLSGIQKHTFYIHKKLKEEVELDELKKSTLASYVKKASGDRQGKTAVQVAKVSSSNKPDPDLKRGLINRRKGIGRAADKLAKEEVEIDEVLDRPGALDSYRKKADASGNRARNSAVRKILTQPKNGKRPDHSDELNTMRKRNKGQDMADRAADRHFRKSVGQPYIKKEEVELDEKGLWDNIWAKRRAGKKMRKPGSKGAPTDADFKRSQE